MAADAWVLDAVHGVKDDADPEEDGSASDAANPANQCAAFNLYVLGIGGDGEDLEAAVMVDEEQSADAAIAIVNAPGGHERVGKCRLIHRTRQGVRAYFFYGSRSSIAIGARHCVGLAVMCAQKAHVQFLASQPGTGRSMIPFPSRTQHPSVHTKCELDLFEIGQNDGHALILTLKDVCHGLFPRVPCRYRFLDEHVGEVMRRTNMCMVEGCLNTCVNQGYDHLHLCAHHVKKDLHRGDGPTVFRVCTKCKKQQVLQKCFMGNSDLVFKERTCAGCKKKAPADLAPLLEYHGCTVACAMREM